MILSRGRARPGESNVVPTVVATTQTCRRPPPVYKDEGDAERKQQTDRGGGRGHEGDRGREDERGSFNLVCYGVALLASGQSLPVEWVLGTAVVNDGQVIAPKVGPEELLAGALH